MKYTVRHTLNIVVVAFFSIVCTQLAIAIPSTFIGNGNFIGPVIPATPVFGRDLTKEFLTAAIWQDGAFGGPWQREAALEGQNTHRMTALPILFGAVPDSVRMHRASDNRVMEVAITFIDAGTYFGYRFGGEKGRKEKEAGDQRRADFDKRFREVSRMLEKRLEAGCGNGRLTVVGKSELLRHASTAFEWEGFTLNLVKRPGHSVTLRITRGDNGPHRYLVEAFRNASISDRAEAYQKNVVSNERGDRLIEGVPIFSQGVTPYCGIHSLAMTGHYLGLRAPLAALVAGAEFKNTGSARGSNTLGLYQSVGEEIGMKVSNSSRFDVRRIERSIGFGVPVIIWRRVSVEREKTHSAFAQELAANPSAVLPVVSDEVKALLPDRKEKGSPSHASVVTGINVNLGEVIVTEPWGEHSRNRRIRVEELEATTYAAFFFRL